MKKPKPPQTIKEKKVLPLNDCLAKTIKYESKPPSKGMGVKSHCLLAGYVARELLNRQPEWLREALYPKGSSLIAAVHDIGKVSPAFQEKIHRALGSHLNLANPDLDAALGGHGAVSQVSLDGVGKWIPEIVGRHHGFSHLPSGLPLDETYGGPEWQNLRVSLVEMLKDRLQSEWPDVKSDIHADLLSGLTCVADWISSGPFFDQAAEIDSDDALLHERVSQALNLAGFVKPKLRRGLSFESIFVGFSPREIQNVLVDTIKSPGIYVLEAPMGLGKTEAALYAAYKAMEEDYATGIYFALPTQLTSDKLYERMHSFLERILDKDCPHRNALLLHGSAWLSQTELGEEGQPGKSWFNTSKRGLLAPFAVGTIDQALMAAMNVKHGFVRTFGLAGKVVILDEVHSYDCYTGTLLDQLAKILKEIHCTVIILSATLTGDRRIKLLCGADVMNHSPSTAYPLISSMPKGKDLDETPVSETENTKVHLRMISDYRCAIEEALLRAERGEQVLWIENTVDEAQQQYRIIGARAQEMGLDFGLLHSRFLKTDRDRNEGRWVNLFGKSDGNNRKRKGRILVGTQVLEQSLDIDADFLVTRLCPTDMLLQRIGRLWRHRINDPIRPAEASRETFILAPSLEDAIEKPDALGKSARVYSPYILCRTLEVWTKLISVELPDQIRNLLEATYEERAESGQMGIFKHSVEEERKKLHRLALIGVARGGKTLPESKASTRHSDMASADVLLIVSKRHENSHTHLRLLDGTDLLLLRHPKTNGRRVWRDAAATLQRNTVRVPEYLTPVCSVKQMEWLKGYAYLGDKDESPFRAALVQKDGNLIGLGHERALTDYTLHYDSTLGYVAAKIKDTDYD